jgi:hypothetical protein
VQEVRLEKWPGSATEQRRARQGSHFLWSPHSGDVTSQENVGVVGRAYTIQIRMTRMTRTGWAPGGHLDGAIPQRVSINGGQSRWRESYQAEQLTPYSGRRCQLSSLVSHHRISEVIYILLQRSKPSRLHSMYSLCNMDAAPFLAFNRDRDPRVTKDFVRVPLMAIASAAHRQEEGAHNVLARRTTPLQAVR